MCLETAFLPKPGDHRFVAGGQRRPGRQQAKVPAIQTKMHVSWAILVILNRLAAGNTSRFLAVGALGPYVVSRLN